jgi:hypothetical protein
MRRNISVDIGGPKKTAFRRAGPMHSQQQISPQLFEIKDNDESSEEESSEQKEDKKSNLVSSKDKL